MTFKPDLRVSAATAQAIVDRVLPGRSVAAISSLHGGEISAVYEVAFAETQPPVVLKVYSDDLHWMMQKEATVSGLIQGRVSVPVPRILLADDTKSLLDLNFIVMSKLEGEMLRQLEPTLTTEQTRSAYTQIGRLLREFHDIRMDAFGYIGPRGVWTPYASNHAYMSFQFDRKLKEFTDRGGTTGTAQRVAAFASSRAQLFRECTLPVFCHNDLHAGNVLAIVGDGTLQLSGIVDFANALAGDPLMDVAKSLYYEDRGNEPTRSLLAGYGVMGRQHWSETIDLYHLYYVLELWCWLAQIGQEEPLEKLAFELERYSAG
jgi:aminoglycoside phosphotransferase (APT) family kinase protein